MTNLAHDKTQMRKTSHYCLLAYVRAFNDFDGLVKEYIAFGLDSPSHQLKQKSINSLQSIILT